MERFHIDVPQSDLDDLRRRLAATRWPVQLPGADWERGVPVAYLKELADYWRDEFDWRAAEARLNAHPQYRTEIDGVAVHFVHVRSPEPDAVPLLVTHAWPGSFAEFLAVAGPLTDPRAHGADPAGAVHLVLPSMPGFGFSGQPTEPGWGIERIAAAWAELMRRLGYDRYVTQGGDLGAWVSLTLAANDPDHVAGTHVNFLITPPPSDPAVLESLSEQETARLDLIPRFADDMAGYMKIQSTRPQTLSYGLTDSPVGQLAWIVEKFREWTDSAKVPEDAVDRDLLLTNVTLYWLTRTAGSSGSLYYEMSEFLPTAPTQPPPGPPLPVPLGVAVFPHDLAQPVRRLADVAYPNIVHWSEFGRGGHFAAMEEPDLYVADLRAFVQTLEGR